MFPVRFQVSPEAKSAYLINKALEYSGQELMPFNAFSTQQRAEWIKLVGMPSDGKYDLNTYKPVPTRSMSTGFVASLVPKTPEEWLILAQEYAANLEAIKHKAEAAAAEQLQKARQYLQDMEALDSAELARRFDPSNLFELRKTDFEDRIVALIARRDTEVQRRDIERKESEARAQAEREARRTAQLAERERWIAKHGSDYLKKAVGAGYDCKKKYLTERAALEYPDYVLDLNDKARWDARACPSGAALDEALEKDGSVFWLKYNAEGDYETGEIVAIQPEAFEATWLYRLFPE